MHLKDTTEGTTSTITAMFRNEYFEVDVDGEIGFESSEPVVTVCTSDVPSIQ